MSRRLLLIIVLIAIDLAIVITCVTLPAQEWLNYPMTGAMALTAYLLWLWLDHAVLRRLGPTFALRAQPSWRKLTFGAALGMGAIALIVTATWFMAGFSTGSGFQEYAVGCREALAESSRSDGDMMYIHNLGMALIIHGFSALAEEIVFRSMGMGLLMMLLFWITRIMAGKLGFGPAHGDLNETAIRWNRSAWLVIGVIVNLALSVCFGLIHVGSPGATTISLINITLSGLIYGQLFILQGNILGAWTMHWFWNVTQSALGLPVSGKLVADGPLLGSGFTGARDGIVSGGMYGPEGSIIAVAVQLLILLWIARLSMHSIAGGRRVTSG